MIRRPIRLALFCIGLAGAAALAGCRVQAPPPTRIYTGPTQSLSEIIARINANNLRIPTFWARQDFNGTIIDDKHQSHSVTADGVILYRAPHQLLITAHNEFGSIFELGVTAENYWLKVVPDLDTLWWGRMSNVAKPCSQRIPIRPDLILDVLAVGPINADLGAAPYPVLRFNNDVDAYMIDSIVRGPGRLLVQKEVWYDRQTLEPRTVLLFDANGRVVLRAHLSNFQPISSAPRAPRLALQYDLLFPDSGSHMQFTLRDQTISQHGIPRPGTIHLPDLADPGVKNVIQVDQDCDQPAAAATQPAD
jgi:hypothetical protein